MERPFRDHLIMQRNDFKKNMGTKNGDPVDHHLFVIDGLISSCHAGSHCDTKSRAFRSREEKDGVLVCVIRQTNSSGRNYDEGVKNERSDKADEFGNWVCVVVVYTAIARRWRKRGRRTPLLWRPPSVEPERRRRRSGSMGAAPGRAAKGCSEGSSAAAVVVAVGVAAAPCLRGIRCSSSSPWPPSGQRLPGSLARPISSSG